ncbi:MAG: FHA domain-containing protein [Gemmatimonadetes bacterium]|nr:FHA domain-containing protein [Gemmatimonadota bacterium]
MSVFKLISTSGDQTIEVVQGKRLVVGRAATSDVPIYDPTISRQHAEVTLANGGVQIKDLGSSNGTFVNGAKVSDTVAAAGDVVTFGKVAFRVREVTPPSAQPAVDPVASTFGTSPPPGATIVRNVSVESAVINQASEEKDSRAPIRTSRSAANRPRSGRPRSCRSCSISRRSCRSSRQ